MAYFRELDGDAAILIRRGVFLQCPLYIQGSNVYARYGAGFVRLANDGSTSSPALRVVSILTDLTLVPDTFGRLNVAPDDLKLIEQKDSTS